MVNVIYYYYYYHVAVKSSLSLKHNIHLLGLNTHHYTYFIRSPFRLHYIDAISTSVIYTRINPHHARLRVLLLFYILYLSPNTYS